MVYHVGDDAIESYGSEQQGRRRGDGEQHHRERQLRHRPVHDRLHRVYISDGDRRVHLSDRGLYGRQLRERVIEARLDDQGHWIGPPSGCSGDSQDGIVDGQPARSPSGPGIHISHDTDHSVELLIGNAVRPHAFADRVLTRPESLSERLADDDAAAFRMVQIVLRERATEDDGDPHRLEVTWRCWFLPRAQRPLGVGDALLHRVLLEPLHGAAIAAFERQVRRKPRCLDSGNRAHSLQRGAVKPPHLGKTVVALIREIQLRGENAVRPDAEIDRPQPLHAFDKQSRAHYQDERECDLGGHEAGSHALALAKRRLF